MGLFALLGAVRVIVGKDKVEVVGDDPKAQADIAALLKKAHYAVDIISTETFVLGDVQVDGARMTVKRTDGSEERLRSREVKILKLLAATPGAVVSREMLLRECWGLRYWGTTRTVDQHIANLRKKLGESVKITSIRGDGYRLEIAS